MAESHQPPPLGADELRLLSQNPLAWVFTWDDDAPDSMPVPIRPQLVRGQCHALVGHIPRRSTLARRLVNGRTQALAVFLGPHAYVSPSWLTDRTRAPTWNFTQVQVHASLTLLDDEDVLREHLEDLTNAMEQGRANPWSVAEAQTRLPQLLPHIVTVCFDVLGYASRFKLGQDEPDHVYPDVVAGLESAGEQRLLTWMHDLNDR